MGRGANNVQQIVPMTIGFVFAILAVLAFVHFLNSIPSFVISLLILVTVAAVPIVVAIKLYRMFFPKSLPADPYQDAFGDVPNCFSLSRSLHGHKTSQGENNCYTPKIRSSAPVLRGRE